MPARRPRWPHESNLWPQYDAHVQDSLKMDGPQDSPRGPQEPPGKPPPCPPPFLSPSQVFPPQGVPQPQTFGRMGVSKRQGAAVIRCGRLR
eukprot:9481890-Pyramimonas_sp.AAC.1